MQRLTWLLFLLLASTARADAIPGPPDDCAPGSLPMSSHGGSWCEDTRCASDADCGGESGRVCRSIAACADPGEATGPRTQDSERGSFTVSGTRVYGVCTAGACETGSCVTARRCVLAAQAGPDVAPTPTITTTTTAPPPVQANSQRSCGTCAVGSEHPAGGVVVALAALGAVFFARRRRS